VNSRIFLVNASLGLYPKLLEDREAYKQQFGRRRWIALASGLLTLLRERRQLRLRIDTEHGTRALRTPTVFIGNNALQLARVGVAEAEAVGANAGLLAAIIVRPISSWSMLWLALRGALGRLGEDSQVETFAFHRLVVNPPRPRRFKVAFDGEIAILRSPFTFEVAREQLWLMVPHPDDRVPVE
jgi:diacylglycerol kinase family enzyme